MTEHWNTGLNKTILGFSCIILSNLGHFGRSVPRKPRLAGEVKGHNTMKLPLLAFCSPQGAREAPPCGRGASHSFDI